MPEKPLSLEHWIDSLNTVLLVASAIELACAAGAGSTGGAGSAAKPAAPAIGDATVKFTFDPKKIGKQMDKRGWTEDLIQDTLNHPTRTVKTRDTRWLPGADGPLNDPATAYYSSKGGYVVRNDQTGVITQISNRNDPNWLAPWDTQK